MNYKYWFSCLFRWETGGKLGEYWGNSKIKTKKWETGETVSHYPKPLNN